MVRLILWKSWNDGHNWRTVECILTIL